MLRAISGLGSDREEKHRGGVAGGLWRQGGRSGCVSQCDQVDEDGAREESKKKSGAGGSLLENRFMFSGNAFPLVFCLVMSPLDFL